MRRNVSNFPCVYSTQALRRLYVIPMEGIELSEELSYEEVPVSVLYRYIRKLRTKERALVKVLWKSQNAEETTWRAEADMKAKYPYLFQKLSEGS